jgi:hypothetical protein
MSKTYSLSRAEKREVEHHLFTPFVGRGRMLRAHMEISESDYANFNGLPKGGTVATVRVFDLVSQSYYTVRRASCGSDCFCAAEIVAESETL